MTDVVRPVIAVACGVLRKPDGTVLIAQRPPGKIAAGKWEFPGGKIERGESAEAALKRELHEELGIDVTAARPLVCVTHDYSDRRVILETWLITGWDGELQSREQQAFAWSLPQNLDRDFDLLAADGPIIAALLLPSHYVFTPPDADETRILAGLAALPRATLLRLRLPALTDADYEALARRVLPAAQAAGLKLVLDRDAAMCARIGADGWHLTSKRLRESAARPAGLVLASVHNEAEIGLAKSWNADALVIGAVQSTATHPDAAPLGWERFAALTRAANLPAYAIGGVGKNDLETAQRRYAQGIAGISAWWPR